MHKLYASNAPRWVGCPGSALAESQGPQGDKTAARAGDRAHEAGLAMIQKLCQAIEPHPSQYPTLPTDGYNAAAVYAKIVVAYARKCNVFAEPYLLLEKTLDCSHMPGVTRVKPDAVLWDARNFSLHVFDFKAGYGPVAALSNKQLLIYTLVVLLHYGISLQDERVTLHLHIIQPNNCLRSDADDCWSLTLAEFLPLIKEIELAALAALREDPPCIPGVHCHYCRARGNCVTFGSANSRLLELAAAGVSQGYAARTPEQLALEADILNVARTTLEQREAGIIAEIETLLQQGQRVPRYAVERKGGWENWTSSDDVIAECLKPFDVDPYRMCTPNQIRKSGKVPDNVVDVLAKRGPGKAKLVRLKTSAVADRFK